MEFDEMEQMEAIWEVELIGVKENEIFLINLYAIDDFYVEEYFDKRINCRVRFVGLHKVEALDAYLEGFRRK